MNAWLLADHCGQLHLHSGLQHRGTAAVHCQELHPRTKWYAAQLHFHNQVVLGYLHCNHYCSSRLQLKTSAVQD